MTWLVWSLLSAVFAAFTAILAKKGVAGVDANLATAVRTSVVVVFTWLLALSARTASPFQHFTSSTWLFLALSGTATGLSWLCYFHALQAGEASRNVSQIERGSLAWLCANYYQSADFRRLEEPPKPAPSIREFQSPNE